MSNITNTSVPLYDLKAISDYKSLGYYDTAILCLLTAVNAVLLLLSVVFFRVEPLKSRGIIPQFSLLLCLIANIVRIAANFTSQLIVLSLTPIQVGSMNMVWVAAIMQYFRYLIKQQIEYKKRNGTYKTSTLQKIVNFIFVSNIGLGISLVVYTFCMLMLMMGMWLSLLVTNTFSVSILAILIILIVLQVVFSTTLIITDLIIDVYRFGFFSGTYTRRDPLAFKHDGIYLLFACLLSVLYLIFSQVGQQYLIKEGLTSRSVGLLAPTFFLEHGKRWLMLAFSGGTCIVIIIKRWIVKKIRGNKTQQISTAEQLDKVWAKEESRQALVKYCESEFSVENAYAYDDSTKYKETKDTNEKIKLANRIYDSYIKDQNSLLLVNTSQSVRASVAEKMEKLPADDADMTVLDTLFDDFELDVRRNLTDTFTRFIESEDYNILEPEKSV